jgi:hypothetical protein
MSFQESQRTYKSHFRECEWRPHTSLKVRLRYTGYEALLHLGMVVWKYFYVDIDLIAKQMAMSRMMKFTSTFPQ